MANPEWTDVYDEIRDERQRREEKWGGPKQSDAHSINDFAAYITAEVGQAVGAEPWMQRRQMIRVAALAVAVIEKIDRGRVTT